MKKIFIPVVGQFTNIGDVLHRRELLSWLAESGQLHVYVGNAPESFVEALKLKGDFRIYRKLSKWLLSLIKSRIGKTHFTFNPGEIRMGNSRLKGELFLFPFQLLTRLKGGKVLRVGIAAMSDKKKNKLWLWKFLFSPTSEVYWRTIDSRNLFNRGKVIPDLAFYDVDKHITENAEGKGLVISMRIDRPSPSMKWFNAINKFSKENNLNITVVSQVRMDNPRTLEIAEKLNAKSVVWPDEFSHLQQEVILNQIYSNTLLVISDRLHVLIAAYCKGAIPSNVLTQPGNKVQHHFSVVDLNNISIVESEKSEEEIVDFLNQKIKMKDVFRKQLLKAKNTLEFTRQEILKKIE